MRPSLAEATWCASKFRVLPIISLVTNVETTKITADFMCTFNGAEMVDCSRGFTMLDAHGETTTLIQYVDG